MSALSKILADQLTIPNSAFYITKLFQYDSSSCFDPFYCPRCFGDRLKIAGQSVVFELQAARISGFERLSLKHGQQENSIAVNGNKVSFYASLPKEGENHSLKINARLRLSVNGNNIPLIPVKTQVINSSLKGVIKISGDLGQADSISVNFVKILLEPHMGASSTKLDTKMEGIILKSSLISFLKSPAALYGMIDGINTALTRPSVLIALSKMATASARAALSEINTKEVK